MYLSPFVTYKYQKEELMYFTRQYAQGDQARKELEREIALRRQKTKQTNRLLETRNKNTKYQHSYIAKYIIGNILQLAMDFHQRFKGKTSIMDKEGIDGIVKSKALPIEIYKSQFNTNSQQFSQPTAADQIAASPLKPILLDTAKRGIKQKTKIFTNITREDKTNISVPYFPLINQQHGQSPSSSSTASSSSQFARGRYDFTQQIQPYQSTSNMKSMESQVQNIIPLDKLHQRNGVLSTKQMQQQITSQAMFQIDRASSIKDKSNKGKTQSNSSIININQSQTLNSNSLSQRHLLTSTSQSISQQPKYKGNGQMNRSSIITDRGGNYSLDNKSIQKSIPSIHNHLSQTLQPHNNNNENQQNSQQQNASIRYQYNTSHLINENRNSGTQSSQGYYPSYSTVSLTGSYKLPPGLNNIVVPSDYDLIAVPKALSQTQALPVNYFNPNLANNNNGLKNQQDSLTALMFTQTKQRNMQKQQKEQESLQNLSQMYHNLQSDQGSPAEKLSLVHAAKNVLEQNKSKPQGIGGGAFRYELDLMEEKHRDIIGNLDRIRQKRTKK